MTGPTEIEGILDRHLVQGGERIADHVIDAALAEIARTPQRRGFRYWGSASMPTLFKGGLATAALIVAVVGTNLATSPDASRATASTDQGAAARPDMMPAWPRAQPGVPTAVDGAALRSGPLDAGTYDYLDVDGQGFNIQFTVPPGWSWNGRSLSKGGAADPGGAAIFFVGGRVEIYADPCRWADAAAPRETRVTVSARIAALAAQPLRSATTPINLNPRIEGMEPRREAFAIGLSVPDGLNVAACDRGQYRSWGPDTIARTHQGPGQKDLVWAIDVYGVASPVGPGTVPEGGLLVDASWFGSTPVEDLSEIKAILASLYVGHWG